MLDAMIDIGPPPLILPPGLAKPAIIRAAAELILPRREIDWHFVPPLLGSMPGITPVVASQSAAPKVLTFQTSSNSPTGTNPYTYSGLAIGAAAGSRVVHCLISVRGATVAPTLSSATIGGVAAVVNKLQQDASGAKYSIAIISAAVPTGTTANVVITWSETGDRQYVGVWSSTGLSSTTAHATAASDSDTSPDSVSLATLNGGFGIFGEVGNNNAASMTWANATERFEQTGGGSLSGADATTNGSSIAPEVTGTSIRAMVAATF